MHIYRPINLKLCYSLQFNIEQYVYIIRVGLAQRNTKRFSGRPISLRVALAIAVLVVFNLTIDLHAKIKYFGSKLRLKGQSNRFSRSKKFYQSALAYNYLETNN